MGKRRNGFTLVELLVVVGIIGILSGLVIVSISPSGYFGRGRDSRRLADLTTIQSALEQYFSQNGSYPTPPLPSAGSAWTSGGVTYLKSMPGDPLGANYEYCVSGSNYEVCATMETTPLPSDCKAAAYGCTRNCCLTNPF